MILEDEDFPQEQQC